MHAKPLLLAALVLTASAARLQAQTVAGDAVDPETGERITAATVVLLDPAGAERASTLTDEGGRFALRAQTPGTYTLRLERVGYTSTVSPPLALGAGQTVQYRFAAAQRRVQLQGIVVSARSRCAPRAQGGMEVATLWEEARKALRGTRTTEETRAYRYLVKRFARTRRVGDGLVLQDSSATTSAFLPKPFVSVPAWRLENGWVQAEGNSTLYFAPDAEILTTGFFQEDRCFRVVRGEDRETRDWIGLAFEPTRDRRVPDIEGVLWLDSATAELRRLEYRYTRMQIRGAVARQVGGEVDFHRLPDGAWIVRSFRIRLPQVNEDAPASAIQRQPLITALREEGGDVTEIRTARGEPVRLESMAQLAGVVFDSTRSAPLRGARVQLEGTAHAATTDSMGAFVLRDLTEGQYRVTLSHPRLDSLEYDVPARSVALRQGATARHDFAVPSLGTLLTEGCPAAEGRGALAGSVRTPEGVAIPATPVTVAWTGAAGADSLRADAAPDGTFRFCGVPAGVPLELRTALAGATGVSSLQLDAGARAYQELALDLPRVAQAAAPPVPADEGGTMGAFSEARPVSGRVLDARTGRPVATATVRLGTLAALTGRDGRFEFDGVAPGQYEIEVRHSAYPDRRAAVNVLDAAATEIEVRVAPDEASGPSVVAETVGERATDEQGLINRAQATAAGINQAGTGGNRSVALAPIVATARPLGRSPSRPFRTLGARRSIVERDEIEPRLQAMHTFGDLARMLSGVNVIEDPRYTMIVTRGARVSVYLDGLYADEIVVRNIQPKSVESMEFIPQGDARYGVGPVLLVWTRTGEHGSRRDVVEKS